ncbi:MAG: PHP domain-containing protein [Fibrobacter sp.]|nr:PHP domain-containing protein [Fibrobacter sp.]
MISVNNHIHSPYSFSPFDTIEQVVKQAGEEMLSVLGISDTGTFEGFSEFESACEAHGIYPLFNVEFEARLNNPVNSRKILLCGKGLNQSPSFSTDASNLMASIWKGTQDRIWKMLAILNEYLKAQGLDINLTYNGVRKVYARNSVRGRHVARALYMSLIRKWKDPLKLNLAFKRLFDDVSYSADYLNATAIQEEICRRLFGSGKVAFVKKKPEGLLCLQEAKRIILEAGGIPCYLLSADEVSALDGTPNPASGLARRLMEMRIYAIEFIPNQMSFDLLKKCALYFHKNGFCVTLGTGCSTFECGSLVPVCKNGEALDEELQKISYEGACIVAANQEMHRLGHTGFVDINGERVVTGNNLKAFIHSGDELIRERLARSLAQKQVSL